jgi:hypothetical protein
MYNSMGISAIGCIYWLTDRIGNRVSSRCVRCNGYVSVCINWNWSRRDWGNIRIVCRYGPFKVSLPNTLPADTGVVPEANGAAGVPNVSSVAMIWPTTFTVTVADVQFDGLTAPLAVSDSQIV